MSLDQREANNLRWLLMQFRNGRAIRKYFKDWKKQSPNIAFAQ